MAVAITATMAATTPRLIRMSRRLVVANGPVSFRNMSPRSGMLAALAGVAQHVSHATNRHDQRRLTGTVDLVAQIMNIGVEHIAPRFSAFRPDLHLKVPASQH